MWRILFVSLLLVGAVFGMFLWAGGGTGEANEVTTALARTAAVNMLVAAEIAYLFNLRRLGGPALSRNGLIGSRPALIALTVVVAAQLLWTYTGPADLFRRSWNRGGAKDGHGFCGACRLDHRRQGTGSPRRIASTP